MGHNAHALLCFGIRLDNEESQPWDDDLAFDGDEQGWWRIAQGFKPVNESPFDEDGEYKPGFSSEDPRTKAWSAELWEWDKAHPFPFDLQMIGEADSPSYILCVRDQVKMAEWDECVQITPYDLKPLAVESSELRAFCEKHGVLTDGDPAWWLTSFYG